MNNCVNSIVVFDGNIRSTYYYFCDSLVNFCNQNAWFALVGATTLSKD